MKLNLTTMLHAFRTPDAVEVTVKPTRHVLRIMDRTGDRVLEWDATAEDTDLEVMAAQDAFTKEAQKGGLAYKTTGPDQGEAIERFDKEAEETIMHPQFQGG